MLYNVSGNGQIVGLPPKSPELGILSAAKICAVNAKYIPSAVKLIYVGSTDEFRAIDADGRSFPVQIKIDGNGVADFSQCEKLQYLDISGNTTMKKIKLYRDGANLETVIASNCTNLTEIDISSAVNLKYFVAKYAAIRTLTFPRCTIGCVSLNGCSNMKTLDASQCDFKILNCCNCTNLQALKHTDEMNNYEYETYKKRIYVVGCENLNDESREKLHSISGDCFIVDQERIVVPIASA
jgi:hypothetical protein